MSISYARPLEDVETVEFFLGNCLGMKKNPNFFAKHGTNLGALAQKIRDAEAANKGVNREPTVASRKNRHNDYRDDDKRDTLREQVLTELVTLDRLNDDDQIKLGVGGAKPQGKDPVKGKQAYFIVGLPASGKSSLVAKTADVLGAMIIDSDFAKRKLPEFNGSFAGANLVHKESSLIVLGGAKNDESLLGLCRVAGFNVVLPTVGADFADIQEMAQALKNAGYDVHLSATILHRGEATVRAAGRFLATDRYVPLGLIFDGYANDPVMHYYRELSEFASAGFWKSIGCLHTGDVGNGKVECTSDDNPVSLLKGTTP
jgi:hypothetical protein